MNLAPMWAVLSPSPPKLVHAKVQLYPIPFAKVDCEKSLKIVFVL